MPPVVVKYVSLRGQLALVVRWIMRQWCTDKDKQKSKRIPKGTHADDTPPLCACAPFVHKTRVRVRAGFVQNGGGSTRQPALEHLCLPADTCE